MQSEDGTEEAEGPEGDEQAIEDEDHRDDEGEERGALLDFLLKEEKASKEGDNLERVRVSEYGVTVLNCEWYSTWLKRGSM